MALQTEVESVLNSCANGKLFDETPFRVSVAYDGCTI